METPMCSKAREMKRVQQVNGTEYRHCLEVSGQAASGAIYAPRCFAVFNESLVMGLINGLEKTVSPTSLCKKKTVLSQIHLNNPSAFLSYVC